MKRSDAFYKVGFFILLSLVGVFVALQKKQPTTNNVVAPLSYPDLSMSAKRVKNSVVGIVITRYERMGKGYYYDFFRDEFFERTGRNVVREVKNMGSGFVIDSSGYILTSYHVVDGASEMSVSFPDGGSYRASIIGMDSLSDLAVLKVNAGNKKLQPVSFANSDNIKVGEWVLAVGNPYLNFIKNVDPTVTVGVVSALHRNFRRDKTSLYQNMIQTDAAINPGNSGGPLIDAQGRVVGVNAFIYTGERKAGGSIGLGFAIPSNRAIHIAEELITYGRRRKIRTGMLLYESDGRDGMLPGLYVHSLEQDGPAMKAGIKEADKIISVDRRLITSTSDLNGVLLPYFPGDTVTIGVKRGKEEKNFDLVFMNVRQ